MGKIQTLYSNKKKYTNSQNRAFLMPRECHLGAMDGLHPYGVNSLLGKDKLYISFMNMINEISKKINETKESKERVNCSN